MNNGTVELQLSTSSQRRNRMNKVSERFKEFREMKELSLEEFAKQIDIDITRYKKIEEEKVQATVDDLAKVCDTYDISADYLVGNHKLPHPVFQNEQEAMLWMKMEQMNQDELINTMEHIREKFGEKEPE